MPVPLTSPAFPFPFMVLILSGVPYLTPLSQPTRKRDPSRSDILLSLCSSSHGLRISRILSFHLIPPVAS
ncbi:hypothetical protein IE53DRAFT_389043 [Violaceomyces palustris]|uniref:Uncharacterized protein n=1 Tax=Violaceomyces palustris TaxID=1673888 RepID=A0ACD0NSD4_9BASI|nr:hypothetical protein IE53DRAFT_389043 [Violaceomyces palustris]